VGFDAKLFLGFFFCVKEAVIVMFGYREKKTRESKGLVFCCSCAS
jgi:hypothetical protein